MNYFSLERGKMNQRIQMNHIKEIMRLTEQGFGQREIARVLKMSRGSVQNYQSIFKMITITLERVS